MGVSLSQHCSPHATLRSGWNVFPTALIAITIALYMPIGVFGKISRAACDPFLGHCIQRNADNRLCFHPGDTPIQHPGCRNETLRFILRTHLNQYSTSGSIAYYNIRTQKYLGNGDWSLADIQLQRGGVALCLTGLRPSDQMFYSVCHEATSDDDFSNLYATLSGDQRCEAVQVYGDSVIHDGCCGPPRSVCPPSHDSVIYFKFSLYQAIMAALIAMVARSLIRRYGTGRRLCFWRSQRIRVTPLRHINQAFVTFDTVPVEEILYAEENMLN
ncbi:hypothetical protein BKA62DRAFT_760487, partial [Auriculariales sp. MPI-PUGE-AT-0066]